jgi:alpha-L-rhamnosidase
MINTANVLGKKDDEEKYRGLLQNVKDAFVKEYVTRSGRLISSTQTAYVLALNFDMLPEDQRAGAADRLVQNINSYGNHLTTGFLGTPYLCHVLTRFGHTDLAYTLLMQETFPSWLYPVKMGATTIWERWNGIRPDSSFEPASMNSFNHYAYGAIGDWMYRVVAGLDTYLDQPGYKHIRIQPHIGGNLGYASASLQTMYGKLASEWKIDNDNTSFDIEIPPNTTADLYLPASNADMVTEGGKSLSAVQDVKIIGMKDGYLQLQLGSGIYHFSSKK